MRTPGQAPEGSGSSARVSLCPVGKAGRCLPKFIGLLQATTVGMTEETPVTGGKLWGIRFSL